MISDKIKVLGTPTFTLFDENMNIKQQLTIDNLVVTTGKQLIAQRLSNNSSAVPSHLAIGSGVTATNNNTTALTTEIARIAFSIAGGTVVGSAITYAATFGPGVGTGTIAEAGLFNSNSGGVMLSRVSFPSFNKSALDTFIVSWVISFV